MSAYPFLISSSELQRNLGKVGWASTTNFCTDTPWAGNGEPCCSRGLLVAPVVISSVGRGRVASISRGSAVQARTGPGYLVPRGRGPMTAGRRSGASGHGRDNTGRHLHSAPGKCLLTIPPPLTGDPSPPRRLFCWLTGRGDSTKELSASSISPSRNPPRRR
jgi:hypothetical protein